MTNKTNKKEKKERTLNHYWIGDLPDEDMTKTNKDWPDCLTEGTPEYRHLKKGLKQLTKSAKTLEELEEGWTIVRMYFEEYWKQDLIKKIEEMKEKTLKDTPCLNKFNSPDGWLCPDCMFNKEKIDALSDVIKLIENYGK